MNEEHFQDSLISNQIRTLWRKQGFNVESLVVCSVPVSESAPVLCVNFVPSQDLRSNDDSVESADHHRMILVTLEFILSQVNLSDVGGVQIALNLAAKSPKVGTEIIRYAFTRERLNELSQRRHLLKSLPLVELASHRDARCHK